MKLFYSGTARSCPVCLGNFRRFTPYGSPARPDARCPGCASNERERAQFKLLQEVVIPRLPADAKSLHVAPETGIENMMRARFGTNYVTGDLFPGRADRVVDLTRLQFEDNSLDFFFASHVLEHIPDDSLALSEIFRTLKPGGLAFLEVPVLSHKTYEDAAINSGKARLREYGQDDHVRLCGVDYADRIRAAGLMTTDIKVAEQFSEQDCKQMRLLTEYPAEMAARMPPRYEAHFDLSWLCEKPTS